MLQEIQPEAFLSHVRCTKPLHVVQARQCIQANDKDADHRRDTRNVRLVGALPQETCGSQIFEFEQVPCRNVARLTPSTRLHLHAASELQGAQSRQECLLVRPRIAHSHVVDPQLRRVPRFVTLTRRYASLYIQNLQLLRIVLTKLTTLRSSSH